MAMFPDSGVPPGEAKNSLPDVDTAGCNELWYSTSRCQPRFDPAAANAMLAEQMNLIMKGEVQYQCVNLDNVERAVRYIIQRGLPVGSYASGGPFDYIMAMNPTLTRYNDYLTLVIIPAVNNQGVSRINIDNKGWVPILRNDGQNLQFLDMRAGKPLIISYWQGAFYVVGLVASQVPMVAYGTVDAWVRTDGNDSTGDGTENTAAKAFRTINGAFAAIGSRYAQTPSFAIHFRLGIPGTYETARLAYSAITMIITGDINNPAAYRLAGTRYLNGKSYACYITDCAKVMVQGVTFQIDQGGFNWGLGNENSLVQVRHSIFQQMATGPELGAIEASGRIYMGGRLTFNGIGQAAALIACSNATVVDEGAMTPHQWTVNNVNFAATIIAQFLTVVQWSPSNNVNVTGSQYSCGGNSVVYAAGATIPGNLPGTISSGGQFIG